VKFDLNEYPNSSVEVFTMLGQRIILSELSSQSTTLDLRELERGPYLVTIGNSTKRFSFRVMLIH
jgi:hypothetical protein